MILKGYLLSYLYLLIIIGISFLMQRFNINRLFARKFVHIFVSLTFLIMYYYFSNTIHIIILPFSIFLLNIMAYKYNLYKLEQKEKDLGTVYYAISITILSIITFYNGNFYPYFAIGLFCMAFADGLAPLISSNFKKNLILINKKTLIGTLTIFTISLIVVIINNIIFNIDYLLYEILIIGISAGILELIGKKGLDNLFLPIGISIIAFMLGVVI